METEPSPKKKDRFYRVSLGALIVGVVLLATAAALAGSTWDTRGETGDDALAFLFWVATALTALGLVCVVCRWAWRGLRALIDRFPQFREALFSFQERVGRTVFWVGLSLIIALVVLIPVFPGVVGAVMFFGGVLYAVVGGTRGIHLGLVLVKDLRRGDRAIALGFAIALFGFLVVVISGNGEMIFGTGWPPH